MSLLKLGNGYKGIFHEGSLTFPLYLKVFLITWAYKLIDTGSPRLHNWTPLSPSNSIFSWEKVKVAQSCSTLFDPMDCSLPGCSLHGIFKERILEKVAISFSRGSSGPRGRIKISALQADSLPCELRGHVLILELSLENLCSAQFSHSVVSDSLWLPWTAAHQAFCPSLTHRAFSNSCPSCWWCHPTTSCSVAPSPPAFNLSRHQSFLRSQFFTSGGQSVGITVSTSVLPMNIQDWFPLEWTCLISLKSKGLSRVFSNTTVQKHQFFTT